MGQTRPFAGGQGHGLITDFLHGYAHVHIRLEHHIAVNHQVAASGIAPLPSSSFIIYNSSFRSPARPRRRAAIAHRHAQTRGGACGKVGHAIACRCSDWIANSARNSVPYMGVRPPEVEDGQKPHPSPTSATVTNKQMDSRKQIGPVNAA